MGSSRGNIAFESASNDCPTVLKVCRICLALDCKLFSMEDSKLKTAYESLTGIPLQEDYLPRNLCSECAQRLINSHNFKHKSIKANSLLTALAMKQGGLTIQSIKGINREVHKLNSTLSQGKTNSEDTQLVLIDEQHYDSIPNDLKVEVKVESENDTCLDEIESFDEEMLYDLEKDIDIKPVLNISTKGEPSTGSLDLKNNQYRSAKLMLRFEDDEDLESNSATTYTITGSETYRDYSEYNINDNSLDTVQFNFEQDESASKVKKLTQKFKIDKKNEAKNALPNETYACEICGKLIKKKYHLNRHMKIHCGLKPHKCSFCEKRFLERYTLISHERIHNRDRPYNCDFCNSKFTQKINLDRHIRIHTGEKPYSCEICGKKCTQKNDLDRHLNTHRRKSFVCNICGEKFSQKYTLNRHFAKRHTPE